MLLLVESAPEAPILQLLVTTSTKFYYFLLIPPPNSNRVDIDFYEATAIGSSFNDIDTFRLSDNTSQFMLPTLYDWYSQNITLEVVAVDRCGRQSPSAVISIPGMYKSSSKMHSTLLKVLLHQDTKVYVVIIIAANVLSSQSTNCSNERVTFLLPTSTSNGVNSGNHYQVYIITFYQLLAIILMYVM